MDAPGSPALEGAVDEAPAVRTGGRSRLLTSEQREFVRAREDFIGALPVAAAVISLEPDGAPRVDVSNERFRELAGPDGFTAEGGSFIAASGLVPRTLAFLQGSESVRQFDASDGLPVGARVFQVRLARLEAMPALGRRVLLTLLDKTAQIETENSLRAEMVRDSLTGLPNRTAFNERVEEVLEDPAFQPGSHAVLVVDITRFSRVNECVGALAGDELLITFARRLFSALRASDTLARTGGNEFATLIRLERGLEDALQAAERIRAALSEPFRLSELEIRIDCSVGCALLSGGESLADEVLRNAQFALKRGKTSGEIQIYEPNQARAARRRFSIETELREAVEKGDLRLALQPIVDLDGGAVAGFEALARWDHPKRGPIAPDEFIAVAEESGLIVPLGRWALEEALRTLADWDEQAGRALPLSVSVNLSPIQIARDDVAEIVASLLHRFSIAGERLTLELTESAIVQDPKRAAEVLAALKVLDVRIAVDDFGTGYTSLAYLQRLPIDILKIDRSFVRGMLGDEDSVAIVRAIVSLAQALGMTTTAEGIDTPDLIAALVELGCSHGQGFHFARPMEPQAALDYWLSRNA
jgi:diguanylate cyclase (GGDEF)-like protein